MYDLKKTILACLLGLCLPALSQAEIWKTTAYCSCKLCCGKSDGITASGKPAQIGTVACNWLEFGTKLRIGNKVYIVQDRGSKSQFGDKKNHIRHLDIWMPSHKQALKYGVKYKDVTIEKE